MTSFSPAATYHAELREHLASCGRAISVQRSVVRSTRGLLVGLVVDFVLLAWSWMRGQPLSLPAALWAVPPSVGVLVAAISVTFARTPLHELARRVDRAAGLQERAITALELGTRTQDHPLALVQMRDAVEHLRRLDVLETFPLRAPRLELLASLCVAVLALMATVAPNPWLVRGTANTAASIAHDQAERVQRLAETMSGSDSEIQRLRDMLRNGARTVDTRSSEPDAALSALEDLEQRVRELSAGDDEMAAALAAAASVLSGDSSTSQLASAINTGDMRQISQATRDLSQRLQQMSVQERQRVARTLQDAANRAARASPSLAAQLQNAANALQQGQAGGDPSAGSGEQGRAQSAASQALNDLANGTNAAAERQRAANQLEASRNAIERALGRTQSRSASSSRPSSSSRSGQSGQDTQRGALNQGVGTGGSPDGDGDGSDQSMLNGGASQGTSDQEQGQQGGSGYGKGSADHTGGTAPDLQASRTEQDSGGQLNPDQASDNPFLGGAGQNSGRVGDQQVNPSYRGGSTQGSGDNASIPIGLRDLVKDYFSGLDQK